MRPAEREKERKADEKQALRLQMAYRNTFSSPEGRSVLMDMLGEMHYFDPIDTEEQRVLRNHAHYLIKKIMGESMVNLLPITVSGILSLVNTQLEGE